MLLLSLATPLVLAAEGREAAVSLSADSLSKEAKPGEPADYTITVSNDGSDDITVTLSTQEDSGCQGFSSTIEQITGTIESGASEDVIMSVNVTQNAEDECDTTIRVNAQVAPPGTPGAPVQEELTVTTTVGEGGGSGVFAISLSSLDPTIQYEAGPDVTFIIDVENTGQSQATVQLELDEDSSCRSSELTGTLDPEQVTVGTGDTESVDMIVELPDGARTQAGDHCFIVRATVTNDPNPEKAQDNISLTLQIPETHDCAASLQTEVGTTMPSVVGLDPGETMEMRLEVENTGNSGWTVGFATVNAPASWIDLLSTSTKSLAYGGPPAIFTFEVTPDASVEADDSIVLQVEAMDGSIGTCRDYVTIQVGQNHAGSMALSPSQISGIEPGSERTVNVIVQNDGNGADTFELHGNAVFADGGGPAAGWLVGFSDTSLTLESHLATTGDSASVQMTVTAPAGALAARGVEVNVQLVAAGQTSGIVTLPVTIAEVHDFQLLLAANDSTGRTDQTVKFPVTLTNTGNVADTFNLDVCDGANPLSCDTPSWASRFSNEDGDQITQVQVEPGSSASFYLDISIQSQLEGVNKLIDMRVTSMGDPQIVMLETVIARVSNFNYAMAIGLVEPGDDADMLELVLPPTGNASIDFWIENIGNSSFSDSVVVKVVGLEDSVIRRIIYNGSEIDGPIPMPRNERIHITVEFDVSESAENGATGTISITAASIRNPTETNAVGALFTIRTVHDLAVEVVDGGTTVEIIYPRNANFMLRVTNLGNIEETVEMYTSEGLRGWSIDVEMESFVLGVGESKDVKVVAKPPSDLTVEDRFQFTVVIRPEGLAAAAMPIDLVASAAPASGIMQALGLSDQQQNFISWGVLGAIGLLILALLVRSRRDALYIHDALKSESDEQ